MNGTWQVEHDLVGIFTGIFIYSVDTRLAFHTELDGRYHSVGIRLDE